MSTDGVLRGLWNATFSGGRWLAPLLFICGHRELVRLLLWSGAIGLVLWLATFYLKKIAAMSRIHPG